MGASCSCVYSSGGQRVGVCDLSFWVYTYLLGPYSHRVSLRPLCLFSPRIFSLISSPQSFWVFTRLLRGRGMLPTRYLVPPDTCWNLFLRETLYSLMMLIVCFLRLVSPAPIRWSMLGFWFLRCLGVYTLCQIHQGCFHSLHGGSDRINIFLDMHQSLCLCFFLNSWEVVILCLPLSWFMGLSKSLRLLLTHLDHLPYKCNLDPAAGCWIT